MTAAALAAALVGTHTGVLPWALAGAMLHELLRLRSGCLRCADSHEVRACLSRAAQPQVRAISPNDDPVA